MTREELIEEAAKAAMKEYQNAHWGKNAFENVAEAVLAVFEKAQCKRCGKLAEGYAFIGDDRYCHPDDGVDCYTLASHELTSLANQAFIEKAQAPTDELNTSAKKVYMSGGHVNKTADSLHFPTDAQMIAALNAWHQDVMPVTRLGVFGTQKEDLMRAALIAAFKEGSMK